MSNKKPRQTGKAAKLKKLADLGYDPKSIELMERGLLYAGEATLDTLIEEFMTGASALTAEKEPEREETFEEIDTRLAERFEDLDDMVQLCIQGDIRSLVIYGPPGLGKTYGLEQALRHYDPTGTKWAHVRGHSTAVGILKQLWDNRHEGNILVLDDCDGVWESETALGLLKIATDTSDIREISYLSEGTQVSDKDRSIVAKSFVFEGTLIFITNKDLDKFSQSNHRFADHMMAIMSRGHYVDLTLRNRKDYMVRIEQVAKSARFMPELKKHEKMEVLEFVRQHSDRFRNLDLRMVIKLGDLRTKAPRTWERKAKNQCFRG